MARAIAASETAMNKHVRTLLSVSLSLAAAGTQFTVLRLILLLMFFSIAIYYMVPRAQSFTVVAATQSVTVTLQPTTEAVWDLQDVTTCFRLAKEETAQAVDETAKCDARFYREVVSPSAAVLWTGGHQLKVRGYDDTHLIIEIQTDLAEEPTRIDGQIVTDNSLIIFDRATIVHMGSLVAKGQITIGELAEAGAAYLTRDGTYQIRENLGFPSRKSIVSAGEILTGDLVRLTDPAGQMIDATMFLTDTTNRLADFDVILTSPERRSAIELTRIGGAQSTMTTRWSDRMANDALPMAVSILLGLFGASLGIARSLSSSETKVGDDKEG